MPVAVVRCGACGPLLQRLKGGLPNFDQYKKPKALDNIIFWVGGPNLGTVHGEKQPSLYFLCGPLPPRTQFHFQNRLSPFFAQLEAAGTFVSKIASFQFHSYNPPTLWIQPLKLCSVFGNTVAPGRKIPI